MQGQVCPLGNLGAPQSGFVILGDERIINLYEIIQNGFHPSRPHCGVILICGRVSESSLKHFCTLPEYRTEARAACKLSIIISHSSLSKILSLPFTLFSTRHHTCRSRSAPVMAFFHTSLGAFSDLINSVLPCEHFLHNFRCQKQQCNVECNLLALRYLKAKAASFNDHKI